MPKVRVKWSFSGLPLYWLLHSLFSLSLWHLPDMPEEASRVQIIPRPASYAQDLMVLLEKVVTQGELPVLQTRKITQSRHSDTVLSSDARDLPTSPSPYPNNYSKGSWIPKMIRRSPVGRKRNANGLSSSMDRTPSESNVENTPGSVDSCISHAESPRSGSSYTTSKPPQLRVRSVTMCLFPAEDLNRASLR